MPEKHLATYLNDHLAGSISAIEMLEHLAATHPDSEIGNFAGTLRADVAADKLQLERLMARLGISQSIPRKTASWFIGKATELKLRLDDLWDGKLRLLEAFEAIGLGIEGKKALWVTLQSVSEGNPTLGELDYSRLIQRATQQRERIEVKRLHAAKAALSDVQ